MEAKAKEVLVLRSIGTGFRSLRPQFPTKTLLNLSHAPSQTSLLCRTHFALGAPEPCPSPGTLGALALGRGPWSRPSGPYATPAPSLV